MGGDGRPIGHLALHAGGDGRPIGHLAFHAPDSSWPHSWGRSQIVYLFEWDPRDVAVLKAAKREELVLQGVQEPSGNMHV